MCPFCYIGKRHFEKALQEFPEADQFEIEWKSFQLDPTLPEYSEKSVYAYLAERKGITLEQSMQMHKGVVDMAKNAGLAYDFEKAVVSNSFKAHRLIQKAKSNRLGDVAEERFFKAYFMEGENLGKEESLHKLGLEIGLTQEEIQSALTDDEYAYQVRQDVAEAQTLGIHAVPFFVFNRKYGVSGAQPVEVFVKTMAEAMGEV